MRRLIVILALLVAPLSPGLLAAEPKPYLLDTEGSVVVFSWFLGKDEVKGRMPVKRADLVLDFDRAANSRVNVTMDVTGARAGFPFATTAMKGPKILDAAGHPEINFVSNRIVSRGGTEADVFGDLTIRGVTLPARFHVQIYKAAAGSGSDLTVVLSGTVNRLDYGADGWADMAGEDVMFHVRASLKEAG